jgi:hypothetical protein
MTTVEWSDRHEAESLNNYITYYENRMADIRKRIDSIEELREIERLSGELLDIEEHVARWKDRTKPRP